MYDTDIILLNLKIYAKENGIYKNIYTIFV